MMPVLESEGKTLFVKKFEIEKRVSGGRNKSQIEIVGILVLIWFGSAFSFLENDTADAEKQGGNTRGVMSESGVQNCPDSFGVQFGRN
jgi:hypothetical protein